MTAWHYLTHLADTGATHIHPHGRAGTAHLLDALDLPADGPVLDLGCGPGATLLDATTAGATVFGVDRLPAMLASARTRLRRAHLPLHLARADAGTLPFPAATFARVYSESVLGIQDAAHAHALLAEVARVLRPGGRFVANEAVWRTAADPATLTAVNAACRRDFGLPLASEANWRIADWLTHMRAAGFTVLSADLMPTSPPARPNRLRQLLGLLRPWHALAHLRYRRLLAAHHADGLLIETRLFILHTPEARA